MEITLEKIELVKDKTGVSYKEAKEKLIESQGSVVDAIIAIEDEIECGAAISVGDKGAALFRKIKDVVKKGNVSRIQISREDEMLVNIPVNVGVVGAIVTPIATAVAAAATFGFRCRIEIVKDDGSIVEISERVNEATDCVVEKGAVILDGVKEKGTDYVSGLKNRIAEQNFEDKLEGFVDKAKDVSDAVIDKAKDHGIDDVYESVKDIYHDITDAAKIRIDAVKSEDDFALNISEDFEDVADAIEEEIAEELGGIKIVDITEK